MSIMGTRAYIAHTQQSCEMAVKDRTERDREIETTQTESEREIYERPKIERGLWKE